MEDRAAREKLVNQGARTLSDAELMSVVIREGTDGVSAVGLSQRAIDMFGGLARMGAADVKTLRKTAGLGVSRAAAVAAAMELGRRAAERQAEQPIVIKSDDDVARMFRTQMAGLAHEEFWVLYLSAANTVVGRERVSHGGVSATVVDCKLVVKRAVELLASGMILVHNHPSGVAQPSDDDRQLTDSIVRAAALFEIRVVDHLIVTAGECFSFRRAGLVE
jgi:DNA repair protein RadC